MSCQTRKTGLVSVARSRSKSRLGTLLLIDLMPGDPAVAILGEYAQPEQIATLRAQLGLDDPFYIRYFDWLKNALTGDLGTSSRTGVPVTESIIDRLPVTLSLALGAMLVALLMAIPVGVYTAYREGGRGDRANNLITGALISSPPFLTGIVLIFLLAIKFPLFPVAGWTPFTDDPVGYLHSIFLPVMALALVEFAVISRLLRLDMIQTLKEDFILAAKAKGMPTKRILFRHALRPSSLTLITVAGLSLGRLIGGAVVVEILFSLPGLGQYIVTAINNKDIVSVQGTILFICVSYVILNMTIEFAYRLLDPRVREVHA